jgi:hypothetical protein
LLASSSAQTPTNIEAAEWNPMTGEWLVSNGANLLSTPDGENWAYFGDAQGSHGMEVIDGQLFTASGSTIRAYDAASAAFLGSTNIAGATFLNGMGSRPGYIYVSDFSGSRIHTVDISDPGNMVVSTLVANTPCTPNGVTWDEAGNRLLFVCWGGAADIHAVDVTSGEVTTVVDNTGLGNLDGIDGDGNGAFYVSSWSPARITRFTDNFATAETVVATGLASPADISFAAETSILGVANSSNETLTLHDFGTPSSVNLPAARPACEARWTGDGLEVMSGQTGAWAISCFDAAGRQIDAPHVLNIFSFPARMDVDTEGSLVRLTDPSGCPVTVFVPRRF